MHMTLINKFTLDLIIIFVHNIFLQNDLGLKKQIQKQC